MSVDLQIYMSSSDKKSFSFSDTQVNVKFRGPLVILTVSYYTVADIKQIENVKFKNI